MDGFQKREDDILSIKKHAMLIMAHNQFEILEKLMIQLDHERNDLYIHIDRKSRGFNSGYFEHICQKSKVVFVPRMSVHWGDSSMTECELRLMEVALNSGEDYLYLHLLSGSDLQIKKTGQIHNFFDQHPDNQFIALRNTLSGISGLNRYYFFLPIRSYNKYVAKGFDLISEYVQRKMKVNRLKGAQFFCVNLNSGFRLPRNAQHMFSLREIL